LERVAALSQTLAFTSDQLSQVKDPQLDRDDGSVYEVVIIAEDRADPRESASTTVTVTVNDVNDKPPQLGFLDPTAVPEDAEIDSGKAFVLFFCRVQSEAAKDETFDHVTGYVVISQIFVCSRSRKPLIFNSYLFE